MDSRCTLSGLCSSFSVSFGVFEVCPSLCCERRKNAAVVMLAETRWQHVEILTHTWLLMFVFFRLIDIFLQLDIYLGNLQLLLNSCWSRCYNLFSHINMHKRFVAVLKIFIYQNMFNGYIIHLYFFLRKKKILHETLFAYVKKNAFNFITYTLCCEVEGNYFFFIS